MEINKDLIAASSTPIVLAILAEEDSYGYNILKRVRELSGGRMEWTDGMLYPVLHRLERLGHVEARWEVAESGRRRKYYPSRPGAGLSSPRNASSGKRWTIPSGASGGRYPLSSRPAPWRQPRHWHREPERCRLRITRYALEEQIDQWRSYLRHRQAIHSVDVAELEDHLREQVAVLVDAGLSTDEAFLVAVKRMGDLDALSREFAREHSERLWKQLVVVPADAGEPRTRARTDAIVAFCLAVAAAVAIKVPALFGIDWTRTPASTPAI